jgi:hypothetical protein
MSELTRRHKTFAQRLREALETEQTTTDQPGRHKHRRVNTPLSSPTANPSRVRHSDELFVERLRKALD